jgi:hypothetical protein
VARRLLPEAFDAYVAGGPGRSLVSVANQFGVPLQLVERTAVRDRWAVRVAELDAWMRTHVEAAPGTVGELITRHRKIL